MRQGDRLMSFGGDAALAQGYNPTLTMVNNLDAITFTDAHYYHFGKFVQIFLLCAVDPTAASTSQFRISLPVTSNFTDPSQGFGLASSLTEQGFVVADITENQLVVSFTAVTLTSHVMTVVASYRVV